MTLKLQDLIPVKEGGKLFGAAASRVSTAELNSVFEELQKLLGDSFYEMRLTRFLPTKEDHGDIDILVLGGTRDPKQILHNKLGNQLLQYSRNTHTHSVLFHSDAIHKDVHVDFLHVTQQQHMKSHYDYYSYNDFSGVIGILARKMHFKYGSGGFQKRFRDIRGNWHDVYITNDLMKGLGVLGYSNAKQRFDSIKGIEDVLEFIMSSPMLDSSYFEAGGMNQSDRKSVKLRRVIDYVCAEIRKSHKTATITDEDYFFKKLMPSAYAKVEKEKQKLNADTYRKSVYNGQWLIDTFGLKPGPKVGETLKKMSDKYGEALDSTPEEEVKNFVKSIL